jgi:competence protein CoiA
MISAKRKSDGAIVEAYFSQKTHGPFSCRDCGDEVILKSGRNRVNHFAHVNPIACKFALGESDTHRQCKIEIFRALQKEPNVTELALELPLGLVRPDVSAKINGVPVAIEVQISSLSNETIQQRTIEYARLGIYVLWLLQWTPKLDERRYTPRQWEKWIHASYYGRVYYWLQGATVVPYNFEPYYKTVPKTSWYAEGGKKMTAGGYSKRLKSYRTPVRGKPLNIAKDFIPKDRDWWEGNGVVVPFGKIYVEPYEPRSSPLAVE